MSSLRRFVVFPFAMAWAIGCGGNSGTFAGPDSGPGDGSVAAQGTETAPCYPNGTCNSGLECLSNICVKPNGSDAAPGTDASNDAPGQMIADGDTPDASELDTGSMDTGTGDSPVGADSGLADASTVDPDASDAGLTDSGAKDASPSDTGTADARDEAGLGCPGATILHPGTQTRSVGTSVPFVGRGRDPNCIAIMGVNLVWTDSIEGAIGVGETFSHTFTIKGTHTVTLTATDSAARMYKATVTFLII